MSQNSSADTYPVDIAASYARIVQDSDSYAEEPRHSAYTDLGGLSDASRTASDSPRAFMRFAELLGKDDRKYDIARGLGGLGLIAVSTADILSLNKPDRRDYATALHEYHYAIDHRAKVLATVGSIDSDDFQQRYPKTDQIWASTYARELRSLENTLSSTRLFAVTEGLAASRTVRQQRNTPSKDWELRTNDTGQFVLCKSVSGARQAA